jgi:L-lactate dehydrogenase complex protein LldF
VYPGPIGKIITPHMLGLDVTRDLPTASSMCGACSEVCPVKIPIPALLRRLREEAVRAPEAEPHHLRGQGTKYSKKETMVWKAWRTLNTSPALYRAAMYAGTRLRGLMPSTIGPWTAHRSTPRLAARTLHELAREHLGDQ